MAQSLEFGLDTFGDVTVDPDGRVLPHAQVIRNVIEEGVLADKVGVNFFGIGEHHRTDFAVSSPEMVLAFIAGRTSRIRVGSATTVLSSDDPVRVFQRFSTLHAMTAGRAEVILGRGWFTEAFRLFGYELSQYDALFEEKLQLFSELIRKNVVTWRGRTRAPLTNQPVFPPIEGGPLKTWIAVGSTPESVLRAAQHDMPIVLAVIGGEAQRFKPLVELYHLAFERLGKKPQAIGVHSWGYVAESDNRACEEFWIHYKQMRDQIGAARKWPPLERTQFDNEVERGSLYVGSAETVARKIVAASKALPISRFEMKYSVGTMPHDKLMQSIELFGTQVIPKVRDMIA